MIFTPIAGGLGDVLTGYLTGDLGYFAELKRAGNRTKVKVWSVSSSARALFETSPHIDEIDIQPFGPANGKTTTFFEWAQASEREARLLTGAERAAMRWVRPPFFLTPEEDVTASNIENSGPYTVVHPFAGRPERSLTKQGVADAIVAEAAQHGRVVVLGGDSCRNAGHVTEILRERFASRDAVISLVNRASVRLQAHLTSRATKFIGAVSCYNCVAQSFGIPALVFGSAANRHDMRVGGSVFAKMRINGTIIHYLDEKHLYRADALVREFLR